MANTNDQNPQPAGQQSPARGPEEAHIPVMQRVLDNPFLLLFLGVSIPTVLYIIWGIMEIVHIPIAK